MSDVKKTAECFMLNHLGNLLSVNSVLYNKNEKIWQVHIKADYPRLIIDDKTNERILKFSTIHDLGTIDISDKLVILALPEKKEIAEQLNGRLFKWVNRVEHFLVKITANNLSNLHGAHEVLNPVKNLIKKLYSNETITEDDLEELQREQRYRQYLALLEELNLVKKEAKEFTYTPFFAEIQKTSKNQADFEQKIISIILQTRYSTIREVFNIHRLDPYVHLESCYYAPAMEAEELLHLSETTLKNQYRKFYGDKPDLTLRAYLRELMTIDVLKKEDNYFIGDEKILETLIEKREDASFALNPTISA